MLKKTNKTKNDNEKLKKSPTQKQTQKQTQNTLEEIKEEFSDFFFKTKYVFEDYLGRGSYGSVIKIRDQLNNYFAVKKFTNLYRDEIDTKRVLREINLLQQLNHKNIIHIYDIIIPNLNLMDPIFIVLEYVEMDLKTMNIGSIKFKLGIIISYI